MHESFVGVLQLYLKRYISDRFQTVLGNQKPVCRWSPCHEVRCRQPNDDELLGVG